VIFLGPLPSCPTISGLAIREPGVQERVGEFIHNAPEFSLLTTDGAQFCENWIVGSLRGWTSVVCSSGRLHPSSPRARRSLPDCAGAVVQVLRRRRDRPCIKSFTSSGDQHGRPGMSRGSGSAPRRRSRSTLRRERSRILARSSIRSTRGSASESAFVVIVRTLCGVARRLGSAEITSGKNLAGERRYRRVIRVRACNHAARQCGRVVRCVLAVSWERIALRSDRT
jgi:hypothetical protein